MALSDLFKPRWQHSNAKIREAAVRHITDEKLLADIAKKDSDITVRIAAFAQMNEESRLMSMLIHIEDQEILFHFAKTDASKRVRDAAILKLKGDVMSARIVRLDGLDEETRVRALRRIHNQGILYDLATTIASGILRASAVELITDQIFLTRMVELDGLDEETCIQVARKINDQDILAKVARNSVNARLQASALKRITRPELLESLQDVRVRNAAIFAKPLLQFLEPEGRPIERNQEKEAWRDVARLCCDLDLRWGDSKWLVLGVATKNQKIVEVLLENGAKVDLKSFVMLIGIWDSFEDDFPLRWIEHGFDGTEAPVTVGPNCGPTALQILANLRQRPTTLKIATELIKRGADPSHRGEFGKSAIETATEYGRSDLLLLYTNPEAFAKAMAIAAQAEKQRSEFVSLLSKLRGE